MTPGQLWDEILSRTTPGAPTAGTVASLLVLCLVAVLLTLPASWRLVRPAVTVVHELGHAVVGVLVGRRFTGFVVRGDMSGHAVTAGRPRGPGRVACTAAGYPAPVLLGTLLVLMSMSGWAPTVLTALLLALVAALPFARSLMTLLVLAVLLVVLGTTWWWGSGALPSGILLAIGAFLVLGSWRHLGAVIARPRRIDDPQVLARLTGLPAWCWVCVFVLMHAAATLLAGRALWEGLL